MGVNNKFGRVAFVLFNRTRRIENLRLVFNVERAAGDFYAKLYLRIYNLAHEEYEFAHGDTIELFAGYENNVSRIFYGSVTNARTYREGVDDVTEIYAADNINPVDRVINKSYRKQTSLKAIIRDVAEEAEVQVAKLAFEDENINGILVLAEPFMHIMRKLARSFGLQWYLYDFALYVYRQKLQSPVLEFSANTGLLETPVLTEVGVNVKTLLEPSVKAGDTFNVVSLGVQDNRNLYSIERTVKLPTQVVQSVSHDGDTHGDIWYSQIEGYHANL